MNSLSFLPIRRTLLTGAALLALTASPVHAEEDAAGGEIIVTAQKREQRLIDVPSTVNVLSPAALREAGVKDLIDASRLTPGVVVSPQISGGRTIQTFTIRGIGYDDFRPNGNPSAAVSIDGAYQGSAALVGGQMFDIERVEILKGPQGTLYGQNTTAGAVNIISRQPTDEWQGEAHAEYGRFNSWRAEAGVGGRLAEGVKLRIAGVYDSTDGFMTNIGTHGVTGSTNPAVPALADPGVNNKANRSEYYGGRAILLLEPTDRTSVTFNTHGFKESGAVQFFERTATVRGFAPLAPFTTDSAIEPSLEKTSYGTSLTFNQKVGDDMQLVAIFGWEKLKQRYAAAGDVVPTRIGDTIYRDNVEQGTAEIRLQNATPGRFDWVVGANAYKDKVRLRSTLDLSDIILSVLSADYTQRRRSVAGFADGSIKLGDHWKIGAGLRYTHDESTFNGVTADLNPYGISIAQAVFGPMPFAFDRDFADNSLSGRLNVSYEISPSATTYVSVSRGFKAGGFDGSTSFTMPETDPFKSERVWTYEAGIKFLPQGGPVQIDASIYYNDFNNLQASLNKLIKGLPSNIRTNVGSARTFGFEANVTVRPVTGLEIQAGVSLLDSKILEMWSDSAVERARRIGNDLPFAPKMTLTGAVRYDLPLGNGMTLTPSVNGRFIDDYYTELDNYQPIRGYFLGNAQMELALGNGATVAGWVRNFTNVRYATALYVAPPTYSQMSGSPRTYGVSLGYRF
ncbi:TonB-dependent receptor [Sphingobium sp. EM0848]|uniref:TonB-dependent receptor n=1 Tax=Sphingobium sp. EM0848 TaxID=2743473 RepID=UPI00159CA133|nr:TonB-dependent receptor [Sphingobium sp. EM0848]